MKKLIALFYFFVSMQTAFSQSQNIDSILQRIAGEKEDNKRFDLILSFFSSGFESDPDLIIRTGQKLFTQSQKNNDIIGEACAMSFFGQGYRLAGNSVRGLEYHHKALELAEKSGNQSVMALTINQTGHVYKDREDNEKAINLYLSAEQHAINGNCKQVLVYALMNLGGVYLSKNQLDSSLTYSQRAYENSLKLIDKNHLLYILLNLAGVQSKLGNTPLAITYYNMAKTKALESGSVRYISLDYLGLAEHYNRMHQNDSCEVYAKKAIARVQNTIFFYLSIKPAKLLTDIYENKNCDSTIKYSRIYTTANDSLYSTKKNQQIQLMTFEEDLRQKELATEKLKAKEQRKQNIQYAAIAIAIITFVILFLLLSRSIIVKTKFIEFFGILGLLAVFEFINLFIHPYLSHATNDSPVLMLVMLIAIGALLIPLHHRLEKWITKFMVEKNKKIRLESAKKTIATLEG